jgi:hypothetical protein
MLHCTFDGFERKEGYVLAGRGKMPPNLLNISATKKTK